MKTPATGINMSHFEFDHDILTDSEQFAPTTVKGVGKWQPLPNVMAQFDVLRFMNWQKMNVTGWLMPPPFSVKAFNERENNPAWRKPIYHPNITPPSVDWTQSAGVPVRVCLNVAKQANANPWLCIPPGWNHENFEGLMKKIIDMAVAALAGTGLKPIFEYSNEVWNGGFGQQRQIANIGRNQNPDTPFAAGEGGKQLELALQQQVAATNMIADYVGDKGYVVLSAQANNPRVAETLLGMTISENVDALGVAPYFGRYRDARWAPKDILPNGFHPLVDVVSQQKIDPADPAINQKLKANISAYLSGKNGVGGETKRALVAHRQLLNQANQSRTNKLQLWAYEGGVDLFMREGDPGWDGYDLPAAQEAFLGFARSQEAGQLLTEALNLWFSPEVGGSLYCGYSAATVYKGKGVGKDVDIINYDFYGHLEMSDTTPKEYAATHKMNALASYAAR